MQFDMYLFSSFAEEQTIEYTGIVQCVRSLTNKFIISYVVFATFAGLRLHVSQEILSA